MVASKPKKNEHALIERWSRGHALLLLLGSALALLSGSGWVLAGVALLSFGRLVHLNWEAWRSLGGWYGGPANAVTAFRMSLLLLLLGLAPYLEPWPLALLGAAAISLDGLDGYLARRYQVQSFLGEYFDKETDAFYVLAMCLILYQQGLLGPWILVVGLLRYVYVLVLFYFKPPERKEKRFAWGRVNAVVLMISLLVAVVTPEWFRTPLMLISGGVTVLAFARSFYLMLHFRS
jgi:phosphatidylglycerophosphate synthase